jgi:hypothetical protein
MEQAQRFIECKSIFFDSLGEAKDSNNKTHIAVQSIYAVDELTQGIARIWFGNGRSVQVRQPASAVVRKVSELQARLSGGLTPCSGARCTGAPTTFPSRNDAHNLGDSGYDTDH